MNMMQDSNKLFEESLAIIAKERARIEHWEQKLKDEQMTANMIVTVMSLAAFVGLVTWWLIRMV